MLHPPLSERDVEQVLQGIVPPGRGDLAELARLFARMRAGGEIEQAPPMEARLLAALEAFEVAERSGSELAQASERRRLRRARRRWQVVAAAAAVVVLGGVGFALHGRMDDNLRTRPPDAVSAAPETGGGSSTGTGNSTTTNSLELGVPTSTVPGTNFNDTSESSTGVDHAGGSSGSATSEVPKPGTTTSMSAGGFDASKVEQSCGDDMDCWIDAAQKQCGSDMDCWADAAEQCPDNTSCRSMLNELCGFNDECQAAIYGGRPVRHHHRYP
jgi:hypothetical protein